MPPRIPNDDVREAVSWLVNLIQVLAVNDPVSFRAVEQAVREIVAEQRRQRIAERLELLNPQGVDEVEAFLTVIERTHRDDPIAPT